ncbi:hypothetical protein L1266_17665 [Pseudoalteromonas sp. Cn5-37]|uniref:hypothetical protein n=1 Tax=Pseudoalteromonas sp. Cn5-37 TaxID=2908886 RepID=UPI001F2D0778|nr:hypothetical protein [Pseudoalteromonas sp. Cn5-37]MCF2918006.1 hypothetical protein [Pseudoalteromonas sp. Cn5-37]
MFSFYIPFSYYKYTRLKGKFDLLSWLVIYPLFLLLFFCSSSSFETSSILAFLIAFLAFFSIYEIGYFENDLITTDNESSPTDRLGERKADFLEKYRGYTFSRYIFSFVFLYIIYFLNYFDFFEVVLISFYFILTRFFFFFHNSIRSRFNILTYFSLACSRYMLAPFLLLLHGEANLGGVVSMLFLFPLLRTFEHSSKPKYDMPFNRVFFQQIDFIRVVYYSFLSLFLYFWSSEYFIFSLCFLIYRLLTFLVSKLFKVKRTISSSYLK